MSADADMRSSRDYEREATASRNRLAGSLRELTDRLTPGQVVDEMLTYAKGGGGVFFTALSNAAKDNPVPSLLIGAGLLMFLSEKTGLSTVMRNGANTDANANAPRSPSTNGDGTDYARMRNNRGAGNGMTEALGSVTQASGDVARGIQTSADQAMDGARKGAAPVGGAFVGAAESARDLGAGIIGAGAGVASSIADTADHLLHGAHDLAGTLGDASAAAGGRFADTAREAPAKMGSSVNQAKDALMAMVGGQPLITGAVGLAIGAFIASSLPKTEAEDEWMGEASDTVKSAVGEVAMEEVEAAKSVASQLVSEVDKVSEEVSRVAEEGGISPEGAAAAIKAATDKIVS